MIHEPRLVNGLKVYSAASPPTEDDIRALRDFLFGSSNSDEAALHRLLERHPSLIGALEFSEFVSEQPLFKQDEGNRLVYDDHRRRDRADIIAARDFPVLSASQGQIYRSTHLIELKGAGEQLAHDRSGPRLSSSAVSAIEQLKAYRHWLTNVPENHELFRPLGWDIRTPMLHLVMGTDDQFSSNPGQFEEIRARLQQEGVSLFTCDELLRKAILIAAAARGRLVFWSAVSGGLTDRVLLAVHGGREHGLLENEDGPSLLLKRVVLEAVSPTEFLKLEESLDGLGGNILLDYRSKFQSQIGIDPEAEADDCFQKLCLRVFTTLSKEHAPVSAAWFRKVARNIFLNHIERDLKNRKSDRPIDAHSNPVLSLKAALEDWTGVDQETRLLGREHQQVARRCVNQLRPLSRQILTLLFIEGLPREEVEKVLGMSRRTFAAALSRAVRELRDCVEKTLKY